jgi:hypothetical protein
VIIFEIGAKTVDNPKQPTTATGKLSDPLLNELMDSLPSALHKDCLDAYLRTPTAVAIAEKALEHAVKAANEVD